MLVSFLFWNLYGRQEKRRLQRIESLKASLTNLVRSRGVDVFIFAECGIPERDVVDSLNAAGMGRYYAPESRSRRMRFFSRLAGNPWKDAYNDSVHQRMTAQHLIVGRPPGILLVGIHFPDRMWLPSSGGRLLVAEELAFSIRSLEDEIKHSRTVAVGDFNMNPFEDGVVATKGFHGVMTKRLAQTVNRLTNRADYLCFFNPMWQCFGDGSQGPPGSYFFPNTADATNHFWNIYDQVMLRPGLIDNLVQLRILDSDGTHPLVTKEGRPRKGMFADHLPLYFQLDL